MSAIDEYIQQERWKTKLEKNGFRVIYEPKEVKMFDRCIYCKQIIESGSICKCS